jgi:hypothetical protein
VERYECVMDTTLVAEWMAMRGFCANKRTGPCRSKLQIRDDGMVSGQLVTDGRMRTITVAPRHVGMLKMGNSRVLYQIVL